MYCKKCEKYRKSNDVYCEECGTKLEHKKREFKISKKAKKNILTTLIVLIVLIIIYLVTNYLLGPAKIATDYFKQVINNDVNGIYSYLDEYKGEFVSKDLLNKKLELIESVDSYKVVDVVEGENQAIVTYEYISNGTYNTARVLLKREPNKYLIFDKYSVESGKLVENVSIKVPTGSSVKVDEVDIKEYLKTTKDNYDTYKIPYLVSGTYHIETELNGVKIEEDVKLASNETYVITNIDLEEELEKSLEQITKEKLNIIYTSAINKINYEEISSNFNSKSEMENIYKSLKRSFTYSNVQINAISFTDISIISATYDSNGRLMVKFDVDYQLNYEYTLNEEKVENTSTGYSTMIATFDYEENSYKLYEITSLPSLKVRW